MAKELSEDDEYNFNDEENPNFQSLNGEYPEWADNPREDIQKCDYLSGSYFVGIQSDFDFHGYKFVGFNHGKGHKGKNFLV